MNSLLANKVLDDTMDSVCSTVAPKTETDNTAFGLQRRCSLGGVPMSGIAEPRLRVPV